MPPHTVPCRDSGRACRRGGLLNARAALVISFVSIIFASPPAASQPFNADTLNEILRIIVPPNSQPARPPNTAPRPYTPPRVSQLPRNQVAKVQQMLNDLGYDAGPADGVAGRRTLEALNAFRRDNGLDPVGRVDRDALVMLSTIHSHKSANQQNHAYGAPHPGGLAGAPPPVLMGQPHPMGQPSPLGHPPYMEQQPFMGHSTHPATGLRSLSSPPPGLRPLAFEYFQGLPILNETSIKPVFTLMRVANTLDEKNADCHTIKSLLEPSSLNEFMRLNQYGKYECWRGHNEFEVADTKRHFVARYHAAIKAFAPKPPFRVVAIGEVQLREYDQNTGQFSLYGLEPKLVTDPITRSDRINVSLGSPWPVPSLALDEEGARALLEKLRASAEAYPTQSRTSLDYRARTARAVAVIEVSSVDYSTNQVAIAVESLSLYDALLREKVYEFPVGARFDSLIQGNFPERFEFPSPLPMDGLYFAAQSVIHDPGDHVSKNRWHALFQQIRQRDRDFYSSKLPQTLAPDDVRLPVFARNTDQFTAAREAQLQKWVEAYRAGLPDELEQIVSLSGQAGRPQSNTPSVRLFSASLRYTDDYAPILEAEDVQPEQVIPLYSGPQQFLLVLPNRLDLYTVEAAIPILEDAALRARAIFRRGPIKPAVDAKGQHVILMHLEPLSMIIENDAGELARHSYEHIPRLDGSLIAGQSQRADSTDALQKKLVSEGPNELTPGLLDLLTAGTIGGELSDAALAHIALRRWHFENKHAAPSEGRFYIQGARQPRPEELSEIIPKFKAWAHATMPALPFTVQVQADIPGHALQASGRAHWSGLKCMGLDRNRATYVQRPSPSPEERAAAVENKNHDGKVWSRFQNELRMLQHERNRMAQNTRRDGSAWTLDQEERLVRLSAISGLWDRYLPLNESCQLTSRGLGYADPGVCQQ